MAVLQYIEIKFEKIITNDEYKRIV